MQTVDQLHVTTYTAGARFGSARALATEVITDMLRSRHVAWEMAKRDLRSQYRTSVLGILLPLLPALTTAAWAILFRDANLINTGNVNMPYPFFVLCGMMLWATFLESMDAPISGVLAEQSLLSKADIPPEAVTLSRLGQVLFNFGIKSILIFIAAIGYRVHVSWTIIFAPLGVLLLCALGAGIGLILSPFNMLYTDVGRALPVATTFWFFTTPIVFMTPSYGPAAIIMKYLNPVTPLLNTTRDLAFGRGLSMIPGFVVSTVLTLVLLAIGIVFHRLAMPIVIDRANA